MRPAQPDDDHHDVLGGLSAVHHLLVRQIRRLLGPDVVPPAAMAQLLATVSDTYAQNDSDRALLEHSLQTVSEELLERYRRLEAQKAQQVLLGQEKRRGIELALLNDITSLALTGRDADDVLRDIVALLLSFAGSEHAEVWIEHDPRWSRILSFPTGSSSTRGARIDDLSLAERDLGAASGAPRVRTLTIEGEGDRRERILLAIHAEQGEALSDELAAALQQHITAVLRHGRTARALHDNAELLRGVTQGTADVVFALDLQGRYVMINPAGVRLIGRTEAEILGATDAELFGAERGELARAEDLRIERTQLPLSVERAFGDMEQRIFLLRKAPLRNRRGDLVGIVGVGTDLTERKTLEAQLLQSQKMEALGQLAGGVAHDFNNLLTVISGNLELLLSSDALPDEDREGVSSALEASGRARDLTSRLLAFGRRSIVQASVFEGGDLLRRLEPIIRRLIGERVRVELDLEPQPMPVKLDRSQLEQVILNLVVNARDAMPDGGTLTVTTQRVELVEQAAKYLGLHPGMHLLLRVEDTGEGMDDATRARIFEPFFTTKAPGKGTGLGLSMVYSSVQSSGGHVSVRSTPGQGTAFDILLPLSTETLPESTSPAAGLQAQPGLETILLVEDEPAVRRFAAKVLQGAGYRVIEAENGSAALRVVRELGAAIDLLLSDVVMPEMGGGELLRLARTERPGLRALFMSGYTDDEMLRAGILRDQFRFVPKPFGGAGLLKAVRDALDAGT
jgi:PAS domain S-box-containing protein